LMANIATNDPQSKKSSGYKRCKTDSGDGGAGR
jgi:hypothetical protein